MIKCLKKNLKNYNKFVCVNLIPIFYIEKQKNMQNRDVTMV